MSVTGWPLGESGEKEGRGRDKKLLIWVKQTISKFVEGDNPVSSPFLLLHLSFLCLLIVLNLTVNFKIIELNQKVKKTKIL